MDDVSLRAISGADELLVEDVTTGVALTLLEKLVHKVDPAEAIATFKPANIVTADRDRIFAALYGQLYGNKIESTIQCRHCQTRFDLDFLLSALLQHYELTPVPRADKGIIQMEEDTWFRLPTGADELLLDEVPETVAENFLLSRCLVKGDIKKMGTQVQEKMAQIAPILNLTMQAHCPECDNDQEVLFDIQTFFLTRLMQERPQLIKDLHRVAQSYHWSADVILNLPRKLRRQYVAMIESEL